MLARDPLTGSLHDVPEGWLGGLSGYDGGDGLGMPALAPIIAAAAPSLIGGIASLFGNKRGGGPAPSAAAPSLPVGGGGGPVYIPIPSPPQIVPIPIPIPFPVIRVPVPAMRPQSAAAFAPQPGPVALPVRRRIHRRRRS